MFGQRGAGERLSDLIATDVRDLTQPVKESQRQQHTGVDAHTDARIARLHFLQRGAGGEGALRDDCHG